MMNKETKKAVVYGCHTTLPCEGCPHFINNECDIPGCTHVEELEAVIAAEIQQDEQKV